MHGTSTDLAARVAAGQLAGAGRTRHVVECGPLTGLLHADPLWFLSYAVATHPGTPTDPDAVTTALPALRDAFDNAGRALRFELVDEANPGLADVLVGAGLTVTGRYPLLVCTAAEVTVPATPPGVVVERVRTAGQAHAVQALSAAAFGVDLGSGSAGPSAGPDPGPAVEPGGGSAGSSVEPDPASAAAGSSASASASAAAASVSSVEPDPADGGSVLATLDGEPVATAAWTAVAGGVTEIVGVATLAAHRSRGLGGLVTAHAVLAAAEAGGALPWLTPGDDGADRVYRRLGFTPVATAVHLAIG